MTPFRGHVLIVGYLRYRSIVGSGLDARQGEQRAKQVDGADGMSTELGEDPRVLQVDKAAFDGDASRGQNPVGLLLGGCERAGAGG